MDISKFRKYWESIGEPALELEWKYTNELGWFDFDGGKWKHDFKCRIKDDPHWELRSRWIDSDFTLLIEVFIQSDEYGDDRWVSSKNPSWRADLKFREAIPVDDGGWIIHIPGDPMPVAGDVLVEAKRRDGVVLLVREASIVEWGVMPDDSGWEIVAYKLCKPCPQEELKKFGAESTHFDGVNEYGTNHPMYRGFMDAIDQATGGKGQRHGGGVTPFLEQRWHNISKSTGFRGLVYQAVKKAEEATEKPDYESFERELLGAMVYLNMALIHVRKHGYTTEVKIDG